MDDLVIEVGSGGNPHPKSHVLAEKFVDSGHRLKAIRIDRQLVLADACCMPFKDKAFDYSIAFHVLEHVPDPSAFLAEMMRISRRGYIETPNALYERFRPLDVHLLELMENDGELLIHKKPAAHHDILLEAGSPIERTGAWRRLFETRPELFHVCYHWNGVIRYRILNDDQSLAWHEFPKSGLRGGDPAAGSGSERGLRQAIISAIRWYWRLVSRRQLNLDALLCCPGCRGELVRAGGYYRCAPCAVGYHAEPYPDFTHALPLADVTGAH